MLSWDEPNVVTDYQCRNDQSHLHPIEGSGRERDRESDRKRCIRWGLAANNIFAKISATCNNQCIRLGKKEGMGNEVG